MSQNKYLDIKVPLSEEKRSGCIISRSDVKEMNTVLELSGMKKGSYIAMLIKRDLKHRKENGLL